MPAYPLTFPTAPKFSRFNVREVYSTPASESPFTGDIQVFEYTGSGRIQWEAEIPPMGLGDPNIDVWIQFLRNLHGRYGTFSLNLQTHSSTIDYMSGQDAAWVTGEAVSINDHRTSDTAPVKKYIATSTGTTGVTAPTGTGTSISDGTVTWDYVETFVAIPTIWRSRSQSHSWDFNSQRAVSGITIKAEEA
jgi:hypothetical protein